MKKIIFIIIFIVFLFIVNSAFAQSKILINEFLIDPQPQSVEVFNSGTESADISNWIIDDDGSPTEIYPIPQNSIIYPNACLVFSSNFYLNTKTPDAIRLFDNNNNLIDSFSYKSSSGSGISYYRFPDSNNYWTTGSATLGFYNQTNVSCLVTPTPTLTMILTITPTITITPIPTETPVPTPQFYDNIFISEAMVNPATGEKEWIELYNDNDFPVNLVNWYLDDLENAGSSPKLFSLEISPKNYASIEFSSSMFNNDGDGVRLLDFNKNLKDSFEYSEGEKSKSWGRINFQSDQYCLQEPTKNFANGLCLNQTVAVSSTSKSTPTLLATNKTTEAKNKIINSYNPQNSTLSLNLSKKQLQPVNQSATVLGINTEAPTVNTDKPLLTSLTLVSFSNSLLTIFSVLLKIKIHEGI